MAMKWLDVASWLPWCHLGWSLAADFLQTASSTARHVQSLGHCTSPCITLLLYILCKYIISTQTHIQMFHGQKHKSIYFSGSVSTSNVERVSVLASSVSPFPCRWRRDRAPWMVWRAFFKKSSGSWRSVAGFSLTKTMETEVWNQWLQ